MIIIYLICVILFFLNNQKKEKALPIFFFFLSGCYIIIGQRVNFYIRKNETDRLEKKMALTMMQLLIVPNGIKRKKKRKRKRTSVQYSITQIDTDKAIVETVSLFFFLSFFLRSNRMN